MDARRIVEEVFPIRSELSQLELVEASERPDGGLAATVRLILWSRGADGERAIESIKEQEVDCLAAHQREDPRLAACVAGWAQALTHVFEQDDAHGAAQIAVVMPHELVVFGSMLALKRPRTAEDFADAALQGRQRLGRFLRS